MQNQIAYCKVLVIAAAARRIITELRVYGHPMSLPVKVVPTLDLLSSILVLAPFLAMEPVNSI